MVESGEYGQGKNMKSTYFSIAILSFACFSQLAHAVSDNDKEKMTSLMKDTSPYVVGMGKSADEVCHDMANDMVKKYGNQLSSIGKSPSDIRDSAYGLCFDATSSAVTAQSTEEIDMWKNAAMQNVNQTFKGDNEKSPARTFLVEAIDKSARIAKPIAFMQEIKRAETN
jgi:hypothetical protein